LGRVVGHAVKGTRQEVAGGVAMVSYGKFFTACSPARPKEKPRSSDRGLWEER
jgi:hypothetical protein